MPTARRPILTLVLVACLLPAADADILRNAPRTGIYVESDYLVESPGCNWYFPASALIRADPPRRDSDCPVVVRIRGTLNVAGARLFARLSDALDGWPAQATRIVLNSRGGDSRAALLMARTIRQHPFYRRGTPGVTTAIDEAETAVCFSACIIVFAAGFERHALFDEYDDPALPSRLGIHAPGQYDRRTASYDTSSDNLDIRRLKLRLEAYFTSVGVDRGLVEAMFAVPFDELHLLTETEARRYKLVP